MGKKVILVLFCIATLLAVLLSGVVVVAFDNDNYGNEALNVINYLECKEELDSNLFSEREIEHMKDVKRLLYIAKIVLLISIILLIVLLSALTARKDYKTLSKCFLYGGLLSIIFLAILFLLSINFNNFFTSFHEIFFTNDLWLLPPGSALLTLFPKQFFYDALLKTFKISLSFSLGMLINGLILRFNKDVHT